MSDSKCQRLDAISGRDQMAEKPPMEEASRRFRTPVCYDFLGYLAKSKAKKIHEVETLSSIHLHELEKYKERTEQLESQ